MSQNQQILSHLKAGHKLTARGALNLFNCFRLAARIEQLRGKGHDITTTMVTRNNKRFAVYSLEAE